MKRAAAPPRANGKKVFVTTSWDDGHKDDVRLAALLQKYRIKGTFYVAPFDREFKQEELLTQAQLKALSAHFEIGAHTMTHPVLTRIPLALAEHEIRESKAYLERLTGKPVRSFCYPRGAYDAKLRAAVERAGYRSARTVERHRWDLGSDLLTLPTTFHAYRHYSDVFRIASFSRWHPVAFLKHMSWERLAKALFDRVRADGGVYHLWGHSWEISQNRDWDTLERVLAYIAGHADVQYVTNDGLVTEAVR